MLKTIIAAAAAWLLCGCSDLAYYAQAVGGHVEVMNAAHPIRSLLDDPATTPELRRQLENIESIRNFASSELGLPDNDSYRSYADVKRPYAVWNVVAAPEFSLRPERWCLWVVGCISYRGYFDHDAAEQLAAGLRREGYDVYVGGVAAYSTLGFFSDPVLNTFARHGDAEVARIVFHELAHQRIYVKDDSAFNESFATAVENEGLRRWFARGEAGARRIAAFATQQSRKDQFIELVTRYRDKLRDLYAEDMPAPERRRAKEQTFADLRRAYEGLKATWGGYAGYDKWFATDLNNAKLASLSLYLKFVPAFEAMLAAEGNDLPRFYRRVEALAQKPPAERTAALDAYLPVAAQFKLVGRAVSPMP